MARPAFPEGTFDPPEGSVRLTIEQAILVIEITGHRDEGSPRDTLESLIGDLLLMELVKKGGVILHVDPQGEVWVEPVLATLLQSDIGRRLL
jgi:hypothetical protein